MSDALRQRIFEELDSVVLIDPHTHINALQPASSTLADILGYHYYTELAHSAGVPKEQIEEPGLGPKEKCGRLFANLAPLQNTIQYSWFLELVQAFFGFQGDRISADNWEPLYDAASEKLGSDDWAGQVLEQSKLQAVFLTNEFDDPLEGFDTAVFIPCLRTDDLVFQLAKPEVRQRLERSRRIRRRCQFAAGGDRQVVRAFQGQGCEGLRDQPASGLRADEDLAGASRHGGPRSLRARTGSGLVSPAGAVPFRLLDAG